MADPVILCLNRAGEATARRIAAALGAKVHGREGRVSDADIWFADALEHTRSLFAARVPIVGVCAAGILVRAVAPLLNDKRAEPPVIAVPDDGSTVVPLLGGHYGANRLARRIATALQAHAAVTTAGDVSLGIALDEPPTGWALANPQDAKAVMAALLSGEAVALSGDAMAEAKWLHDLPQSDDARLRIIATAEPVEAGPEMLVFHPRRYALGVGCARGCDPAELSALVDATLSAANLAAGGAVGGVFDRCEGG